MMLLSTRVNTYFIVRYTSLGPHSSMAESSSVNPYIVEFFFSPYSMYIVISVSLPVHRRKI